MPVTLNISFNDAGFFGPALQAIASQGADTTELLTDIGAGLVSEISQRFGRGEDPQGRAWVPTERGGMTLVQTGRLAQSFSFVVGRDEVEAGTPVIYAGIHQTGGTIRAKGGGSLRFEIGGREIFVRSVQIPARPMVGWGPGEDAVVADAFERGMARAFQAGSEGAGSVGG